MTRIIHDQKQSNLLPKKETPKDMLPKESTMKTQANSLAETTQATHTLCQQKSAY